MPRYVHDRSIRIDRIRKIKTFGDKVKEVLQQLAGLVVILVIIGLIFG